MKKVIFCLCLFVIAMSTSAATLTFEEGIPFSVRFEDPTTEETPIRKAPVVIPSVSICGHTLLFATSCEGCALRLINAERDVEYTTVVTSETLLLPLDLQGEYEIQILCGHLCFYGYITL